MDRIEELLVFVTVADMRGFAQAGRRLSIELKDGKIKRFDCYPGVGHFCSARGLEQPRRRF